MHAAPPVRVRLARSAGWIVFNALGAGIAGANMAAWWALRHEVSAAAGIAALCGVTAASLASGWAWRAQAPGELIWNATVWQWQGIDGAVRVTIDLDDWMLLRFAPVDGRRCWIAASKPACIGPWNALRAALHAPPARQPAPAPPA